MQQCNTAWGLRKDHCTESDLLHLDVLTLLRIATDNLLTINFIRNEIQVSSSILDA